MLKANLRVADWFKIVTWLQKSNQKALFQLLINILALWLGVAIHVTFLTNQQLYQISLWHRLRGWQKI